MKRKQTEPVLPPKARLFAIDKLIPYEKNPRTHPEHQVGQLMNSIAEFGFVSPIVIDENMRVIAGHGRLMAANRLGLEKVPCIVVGHLTEAQRRAYIIADNRLAMDSDWDPDLLKEELQDLDAETFDLDVLGFTPAEIESFTVEMKSVKKVRNPKTDHKIDCPKCGHRFIVD